MLSLLSRKIQLWEQNLDIPSFFLFKFTRSDICMHTTIQLRFFIYSLHIIFLNAVGIGGFGYYFTKKGKFKQKA